MDTRIGTKRRLGEKISLHWMGFFGSLFLNADLYFLRRYGENGGETLTGKGGTGGARIFF